MPKVRQFTATSVGWTSLVALAVVRALEMQTHRPLDREALICDYLIRFPSIPATSLPRLIREVAQIVAIVDAQNG